MTKQLDQSNIYGLIAGQGDLPCRLIRHFQDKSEPLYVVAFEGQTPAETVTACDHIWVKLGTVGPIFDYFKRSGVTHVILAGGIKRPALSELSLDWMGTKVLARLGLKTLGDDGVLSAVVKLFEDQGFCIVGADQILSELAVPVGSLTSSSPTEEDQQDIAKGICVLQKLGEADVGQAMVIQQGLVLGVEAIEGTSLLVERVASYQRPGRGGILVKMAKPNQNTKVDLPTVGPETIEKMLSSGLVGLAIESKHSQILHREETVALANKYGLFIYGFETSFSPEN